MPINCAAIPNELMEAELFGYARGAFSGAVQRYDGQLMAAAGGTVFLDEIDDTPLETQVKLLRVLEDHVVSRLGENEWHEVDFRIVAATNRDLRAAHRGGALRRRSLRAARDRARSSSLRCASGSRICRRSPATSSPASRAGRTIRHGSTPSGRTRSRALAAIRGRATSASCGTCSTRALVYKRAGRELLLSDLPSRVLRTSSRRDALVDGSQLRRRLQSGTLNLRDEIRTLEQTALAAALEETGGNATRAARLLGAVGRGAARDPGGTVRAMKRRLGYRG